jgi:hypothetical protein
MHAKLKLAGWVLTALCATGAVADPAATPPANTGDEPAPLAADADVYVYPSRGQSDKQLDRDRYECHNWAVSQSHYNPSEPHLAPHQQIQVVAMPPTDGRQTAAGAITGAVIGSVIAGPRDAGRGAVAGAIVGGAIGASSESARRKESDRVNTQANADTQAERARLERQASDYRRAISACLEGRGYTVK